MNVSGHITCFVAIFGLKSSLLLLLLLLLLPLPCNYWQIHVLLALLDALDFKWLRAGPI